MKTRAELIEQIGELTLALRQSHKQFKEMERRYINAVLDVGQIARTVERAKLGLSEDDLAPLLNRPGDPPVFREAKRGLVKAVTQKAHSIRQMKTQNPNSGISAEKLAVLDTAFADYQSSRHKTPGRRDLKRFVDDVIAKSGKTLRVGERICGTYLKQRAIKKA